MMAERATTPVRLGATLHHVVPPCCRVSVTSSGESKMGQRLGGESQEGGWLILPHSLNADCRTRPASTSRTRPRKRTGARRSERPSHPGGARRQVASCSG